MRGVDASAEADGNGHRVERAVGGVELVLRPQLQRLSRGAAAPEQLGFVCPEPQPVE